MDLERADAPIDALLSGLMIPDDPARRRWLTRRTAFVADGLTSTIVLPGDWPTGQLDWYASGDPPPRPNSSLRPLVDGKETYSWMVQAMDTAGRDRKTGKVAAQEEASQHFILLIGWSLDFGFALDGGQGKALIDHLKAAYDRGVTIRILLWDNPLLGYEAAKFESAKLFGNTFNPTQTERSPRQALFFLDHNTRVAGSHHQKILLVYGADGLIGFFGGVDFAPDRVKQTERGDPQHDVHAVVMGEAAKDLYDIAAERFRCSGSSVGLVLQHSPFVEPTVYLNPHPGVLGLAAAECVPPLPSPPKLDHGQLAATVRFATTSGNPTITKPNTLWPQILNGISKARHFIYMQDQYLWSLDAVDALVAAVEARPELQIIILVPAPPRASMAWLRRAATNRLVKALNKKDKLLNNISICRPVTGSGTVYAPITRDLGPLCYVHSKVWIFDDELGIIGSANCNNRGYHHDSEVIGAFSDPDWAPDSSPGTGRRWYQLELNLAHRLRMRLWAHHLKLSADQVHDPLASALYWRHPRPLGGVVQLREDDEWWYNTHYEFGFLPRPLFDPGAILRRAAEELLSTYDRNEISKLSALLGTTDAETFEALRDIERVPSVLERKGV